MFQDTPNGWSIVNPGASSTQFPTTGPSNPPGISAYAPLDYAKASTETGFDPIQAIQNLHDQWDAISGPSTAADAGALRAQYSSAIGPSSDAFSNALSQPAPAYQAASMNPWVAMALTLGGALTNHYEPASGQNGAQMVAGPVAALQQAAQDKYAQQKEAYQQGLQNAQAQYGLAKDHNQNLLDQASQADAAGDAETAAKQNFIAQGIDQLAGQDFDRKQLLIKSAIDKEAQDSQNTWAAKQAAIANDQKTHGALIDYLQSRGDKAGLAQAFVHDYLEGKPVDPSGNPLDPRDAAYVGQLRQSLMAKTPQDLADDLRNQVAQATLRKVNLEGDNEQRRLDSATLPFRAKLQGLGIHAGALPRLGAQPAKKYTGQQFQSLAQAAIALGADPAQVGSRLQQLNGGG